MVLSACIIWWFSMSMLSSWYGDSFHRYDSLSLLQTSIKHAHSLSVYAWNVLSLKQTYIYIIFHSSISIFSLKSNIYGIKQKHLSLFDDENINKNSQMLYLSCVFFMVYVENICHFLKQKQHRMHYSVIMKHFRALFVPLSILCLWQAVVVGQWWLEQTVWACGRQT